MTPPAGSRRRYRIILRGECQHLLTDLLDGLLVENCRGWTCVMASVRDESELYGLLERFQEFALHIVSLSELGADAGHLERPGLDARTGALVRLATLVAADGSQAVCDRAACDQAVTTALDHGVTPDEITGVLAALPPGPGAARLAAAGPAIRGAIDRATAG
jgi:alkylhydroperoxidase/carboxymuconolactone decarboxylase family protein YurZ